MRPRLTSFRQQTLPTTPLTHHITPPQHPTPWPRLPQAQSLPSSSCLSVTVVPERYDAHSDASRDSSPSIETAARLRDCENLRLREFETAMQVANSPTTDDFRQAPFDRRVREEVHRDARSRGPPSRLHHRMLPDPRHIARYGTNQITEPRTHPVRRVGHRWSGEVWWSPRWILHQRPVRYHHVRRYLAYHIQERPQLAPYVCDTFLQLFMTNIPR